MEMLMVVGGEMESSASEELEFSKPSPQIVNRKRTKRRRLAASRSSSGGGGQSEEDPNSTVTTSEEDEDMANCLILLARGGVGGGDGGLRAGSGSGDFSGVDLVVKSVREDSGKIPERKRKAVSRTSAETSPVFGEMNLSQVYECKTCEKSFQSLQALGGHRASHHKKARLAMEDGFVLNDVIKQEQVQDQIQVKPHPVPVKPSTTVVTVSASVSPPSSFISVKSHECAICGSAFSSGQALGGHMRRHRVVATTTTTPIVAETSSSSRPSFLSLDLNLPAPADDEHRHHQVVNFHHHQQFQIQNNATDTTVTAPLVFSATALVDCYF